MLLCQQVICVVIRGADDCPEFAFDSRLDQLVVSRQLLAVASAAIAVASEDLSPEST
jgi:hypothetical protein